MSDGEIRKKDARDLARVVDEILFWVWDPIGINDDFRARDEYQTYSWQVVKILLDEGSSEPRVETIESYLDDLATGHIGLSLKPGSSSAAANRILNAYGSWMDGLR